MANFQFELGIDWGLYTIQNGKTGALQNGCVQTSPSLAVTNAVNLGLSDSFDIFVYDTTSGGPQTQTVDSVKIVVLNAHTNANVASVSSISGAQPAFFQLGSIGANGNIFSTSCQAISGGKQSFSFGTGASYTSAFSTSIGGSFVSTVVEGRYLMTITVTASNISSTLAHPTGVWRHDPEMIVGGTG